MEMIINVTLDVESKQALLAILKWGQDYSLYDCCHSVIRPKHMTSDELMEAFWAGLRRFYSLPQILKRMLRDKRWYAGGLLYDMYCRRQVYKGLHPFAGNS